MVDASKSKRTDSIQSNRSSDSCIVAPVADSFKLDGRSTDTALLVRRDESDTKQNCQNTEESLVVGETHSRGGKYRYHNLFSRIPFEFRFDGLTEAALECFRDSLFKSIIDARLFFGLEEKMPNYAQKFDEGFIQTTYGKIHYKRHTGSGSKLLLLHGLGVDMHSWDSLVEKMPPNLNLLMIDLLGHGESAKPKLNYSVSIQLAVQKEIMGQFDYKDCFVMGHSYGGWIAAASAICNDKIKGLILEDPVGFKRYFNDLEHDGNPEKYRAELLEDMVVLNHGNRFVMESTIYGNFRNMQLTGKMLSMIRAPTLILWGLHDNLIPPNYAKVLTDNTWNPKLTILKLCGHTPHKIDPNTVAKEMLGFIGACEVSLAPLHSDRQCPIISSISGVL